MHLSRKNKFIIILLLAITIIGFLVYSYSVQPPSKIENKKVDFMGTSNELLDNIQKNTAKWQDKVVVISGEVTDIDEKGIILSSRIYCQLNDSSFTKQVHPNHHISIKGRIIGYDDLLEELKLDQCLIQ